MTKQHCKVIFLSQRKTTLRLRDAEWDAIEEICERENIKRNDLFELINSRKNPTLCLTSAIKLFSLVYYYQLLQCQQQKYNKDNTINAPIFEAITSII